MAEKTVILIGSKLPIGLILRHPLKPSATVEIQGLNRSKIIGATHVTTEVDKDFWDAWKLANNHETRPFKPFASGAIFEAKSEVAASAIAKERANVKTGLEPLDKMAEGVKPATNE